MTSEVQGPFGDAMYRAQRRLYSASRGEQQTRYGFVYGGTRNTYEEARNEALEDPEFDFFQHYMPTQRTKHDIGRYALANGINVPLIKSLSGLGDSLRQDGIAIRSDGVDDYTGESGVRSSAHWGFFGDTKKFNHYWWLSQADQSGLTQIDELITKLTLNGSVYPGFGLDYMNGGQRLYPQNSSLWRYIPGSNITIVRDPVIENTYHYRFGDNIATKAVGGLDAPDHPEFFQAGGHTLQTQFDLDVVPESLMGSDYVTSHINRMIPVGRMIELYETVRTLPYFDQRQLPVMEMQYDGKKFYFLQYLKTGRMIESIGAFPLPDGADTLKTDDVFGATSPEGEAVRIYVGVTTQNGDAVKDFLKNEAVLFPHEIMIELHNAGAFMQRIAMNIKIALIDSPLVLHNHHFGSAMLVRTPVNIGLRGHDDGALGDKLESIHYDQVGKQRAENTPNSIGYINAIVTSNGREATVSSDWELRQAHF